jgi:hypothetical protein
MSDEGHEGSAILFMLGITQIFFSINMWEELNDTLKSVFPSTISAFMFLAFFMFIQEKRIKKWNFNNGYNMTPAQTYQRDENGNVTGAREDAGYWNLKMMGIWFVTMLVGFPILF